MKERGINMRNFIRKIRNKADEVIVKAKSSLANIKGEGYVDSGVKILIAVVIGALLLAGLYSLFEDTVMPAVVEKVEELFDYAG